jgi:hypothetical protein
MAVTPPLKSKKEEKGFVEWKGIVSVGIGSRGVQRPWNIWYAQCNSFLIFLIRLLDIDYGSDHKSDVVDLR